VHVIFLLTKKLKNMMGNLVNHRWTVPEEDDHRFPVWRQTPLTNADTGKVGFPDKR